ncbi:class I SAM-dependent methyltransferase [Paenibacillus sp. TH7-28]
MSIGETIKWYEKSFGEDYLLVYKHRNQQEADRFVQKVMDWLKLPPGSRILDLCCGAGRHALALADAGYRVTGADLSPVLLRKAKEADSGGCVRWVEADMRALPEDSTFTECFVYPRSSRSFFQAERERCSHFREPIDSKRLRDQGNRDRRTREPIPQLYGTR